MLKLKKVGLVILSLFLIAITIFAKEENIERHIALWHIDTTTGIADSLDVTALDTALINFHQRHNPVYQRTIASSYLANIGSPFQDKIYFNREPLEKFIFLDPYSLYRLKLSDYTFYNTTTPFADIQYTNGVGGVQQGEDRIKGKFTVNANDKFNLGFQGDLIFGRGKYASQSTKQVDFGIFTSYNGIRYTNYNIASICNFKNYENGGIKDDRYITNPESIGVYKNIKSINIPVNLSNNSNWLRGINLYTNHQYHLGKDLIVRLDSMNADSIVYKHVPISTLSFSTEFGHYARKYTANSFSNWYGRDSSFLFKDKINDSIRYENLKTSFSVIFNEEASKTKFGFAAYVENECRWYKGYANRDTSKLARTFEDDFIVGAKLFKKNGDYFRFDVDGNIVALGTSVGSFSVEGGVEFSIPLKNDYYIDLGVDGNISYANQSLLLDNYCSTYFEWTTPLDAELVAGVTGELSIPKAGFEAFVGFENTKNKIFWNQQALPDQTNKNVQILQISASESYEIFGFGFDAKAVYQLSSNQSIVPLPTWSLYGNIYYTNKLFKVLTFQLGVDCYYNTAYYAPAYMPATGQFYNQQEKLIGNYPEMNVYLNFHLKRVRFYLAYMNFNRGLFGGDTYFNVPHYPLNPGMFKFGLSWTFYD